MVRALNDARLMGKTIPLAYGGRRRGFAELMNACNSHRVGAATVALGIAACAFDLAREQGACRRIATTVARLGNGERQ